MSRRMLFMFSPPRRARAARRTAALAPSTAARTPAVCRRALPTVPTLAALALLASLLPAVSPTSYSGPPTWHYANVTDPASGQTGCRESGFSNCCCGLPCGGSYSICPVPCGSADGSMFYRYACGLDNGVPPSSSRFETTLLIEERAGRCELARVDWLAVESPETRSGYWSLTMCGEDFGCPWDELKADYGDALSPINRTWRYTPYQDPTIASANLTVRQPTGKSVDALDRWCAVAMGCPADVAAILANRADDPGPGNGLDPNATYWACLNGNSDAAEGGDTLVRFDGKGNVACLAEAWGDTKCRRLAPVCCKHLDGRSVRSSPGLFTLPHHSCADVPAADRGDPAHVCTRGRELLERLQPEHFWQAPSFLGFNCTYVASPDSAVDASGAGPWTAVLSQGKENPGSSWVVARRLANSSLAALIKLDGLYKGNVVFFWTGPCAANAAATAPPQAGSIVLPFNTTDSPWGVIEALAGDGDRGPWTCVEGCPGSGEWIRGRRLFGFAAIQQVKTIDYSIQGIVKADSGYPSSTGSPVIYSDPSCTVAVVSSYKVGGSYFCRPGIGDNGNPWDPWCARMLGAVLGPQPSGCATTASPSLACVMSPGDKGHYVLVKPQTATRPGGTNITVPGCVGPDEARCSWFADDMCLSLARDEPYPTLDSQRIGYVCKPDEGSWCRLAAEALRLVPKATSTPSTATTTASPATSTTGSTAATLSTPRTTQRPMDEWTCVRSCKDRGNAVLVRPSAGGRAQCLGPDSLRCSWFVGSSGCGVLAAGEPAPDASREVGKTCTAEEEAAAGSWCQAAKALLGGAEQTPCPVLTATAGSVETARPSAAALGRKGMGLGIGTAIAAGTFTFLV
ncbi:hypothetical protein DFJ74DRAFT_336293 [Hyaloraphidium curvatum]|nr:hypothetical protein DFJ74DRAFT_336293 [Hyaloraphidium curvatum]